jgi:L-amino acid N-acyltransferase YncA
MVNDQPAGHAIALRKGETYLLIEFNLLEPHRLHMKQAFAQLCAQVPLHAILAKTTDTCLVNLLCDHCENIQVESIHFRPHSNTALEPNGAVLMRPTESDVDAVHAMFTCEEAVWPSANRAQTKERIDQGLYLVLKVGDAAVGVGALAPNRLQPQYVDVCNYVLPQHRRKGYGAFILQELTKECARRGLVACAGCDASNKASLATLHRAGFWDSHRMLRGTLHQKFAGIE